MSFMLMTLQSAMIYGINSFLLVCHFKRHRFLCLDFGMCDDHKVDQTMDQRKSRKADERNMKRLTICDGLGRSKKSHEYFRFLWFSRQCYVDLVSVHDLPGSTPHRNERREFALKCRNSKMFSCERHECFLRPDQRQ